MHQETRKLTLFLLATFTATWATHATIVFNGWDPPAPSPATSPAYDPPAVMNLTYTIIELPSATNRLYNPFSNRDDVRVQRTRYLLRKTLMALVADQRDAHVTIRAIIPRARVDLSSAFCLVARSKA